MVFKIHVFIVHGKNRYESIIILLQVVLQPLCWHCAKCAVQSWSFWSRDISVRLRNLAEILCSLFNANVLKSTKGFIKDNDKRDPRSSSLSAWTYGFHCYQQEN